MGGFMPELPELLAKARRRKAHEHSGFTVLRTESKDEFARLLADISEDIRPKNWLQKMYVGEVARQTWDVMRYYRIKNGIMNNALRSALAHILRQILLPPSAYMFLERWSASDNLAYQWLFDEESKRRVLLLLQEAGYDYSAIEAEAYLRVADELANADRMLKAARDARDKALRSISKFRKGFGDQLRRKTDLILAADEIPPIASDAEG
jgi:hypothetical protein